MAIVRALIYMAIGALLLAGGWYAAHHASRVAATFGLMGHGDDVLTSARAHFKAHEAEYTALAEKLEDCRGSGLVSIYPDGHVLDSNTNQIQCPAALLTGRIAPLGVDWINVAGHGPGTYELNFVAAPSGSAERHSGTIVYYYPAAQVRDPDGSLPLAGADRHWFLRLVP